MTKPNPQIYAVTKWQLYAPLLGQIMRNVSVRQKTSYEIYDAIRHTAPAMALRQRLSNYHGLFANDVTHIGSICMELADQGMIRRTVRYSPVLGRMAVMFSF